MSRNENAGMNKRSQKAFWTAFLSGVAAPGMLCAADTPRISRVEFVRHNVKSDVESMRSDWVKIGKDFNTVIQRETAPAK